MPYYAQIQAINDRIAANNQCFVARKRIGIYLWRPG